MRNSQPGWWLYERGSLVTTAMRQMFPRAAQSSLVTPSLAFLVNSAMELDYLPIVMARALRQNDTLAKECGG